MKICVIGHSKGLGQYVYNYFNKNHEVIGFSRSNGYELKSSFYDVMSKAESCDLVINNAPVDNTQVEVIEYLCNKVPKIITMGSIASNFPHLLDKPSKIELERVTDWISLNPKLADILLLKISFLEGTTNAKKLTSDQTINFSDIIHFIEFWLKNPKIYKVDYVCKLTPYTIEKLKEFDSKDNELFEDLLYNAFKY